MAVFKNPILAGDYPDPTIVRDGADYYMTCSCGPLAPGLKILHSRDLVHWRTISTALKGESRGIAAPELIRYGGLYYLYYPEGCTNYVTTAPHPEGPWSEPIDLKVGHIDPGHIATPEGERFLFLSGGLCVRLAPDGLSLLGAPEKVYSGWDYGDRYVTEGFFLESPKLFFRNGYYYMISAQGGTAGPATAHMAVAARARHPLGPWESAPGNPLVHTESRLEKWWCKGHGTIFEDHRGGWWIVYHAYERDFLNLGRNALLQPVGWGEDGWPMVLGCAEDVFQIDPGENLGVDDLSDDFSGEAFREHWTWWKKREDSRYRLTGKSLIVRGADCARAGLANPMTCSARDHAYEISAYVRRLGDADAGLILQYDEVHYAGISLDGSGVRLHKYGKPYVHIDRAVSDALWLKIVNDHHQVSYQTSEDGLNWNRIDFCTEVSGLNHNALDGYGSLRPGLFALGRDSEAEFTYFSYRPLN